MVRRSSGFKVCTKCKAVNDVKASECWNCGGKIFTSRWDGLIIIISEDSKVLDMIEKDKVGYYAIKVL